MASFLGRKERQHLLGIPLVKIRQAGGLVWRWAQSRRAKRCAEGKQESPFCSPASSEPLEAARARSHLGGKGTPRGIWSQGPFKEMNCTWEGWGGPSLCPIPKPGGRTAARWTVASLQASQLGLPVPARPSPQASQEAKPGWSCCQLRQGNRAGGKNPPKSLCLLPTHQCCLYTAITEASGAFTPSHLGLLVLNNLICLMTCEAPGAPCCLDLLPWSPKGFSPWRRQPPPRAGGHRRAFVRPAARQVLSRIPGCL